MGFITDLELEKNKKLAAQQIKSWSENAINAINQTQINKQSLVSQLDLMKLNTNDYNQDDCTEVQNLINTINEKSASI